MFNHINEKMSLFSCCPWNVMRLKNGSVWLLLTLPSSISIFILLLGSSSLSSLRLVWLNTLFLSRENIWLNYSKTLHTQNSVKAKLTRDYMVSRIRILKAKLPLSHAAEGISCSILWFVIISILPFCLIDTVSHCHLLQQYVASLVPKRRHYHILIQLSFHIYMFSTYLSFLWRKEYIDVGFGKTQRTLNTFENCEPTFLLPLAWVKIYYPYKI